MNERIVNIVAKDGCFYQSAHPQGTSDREIVENILSKSSKPLSAIYNEKHELMWKDRYTVKKADGTYELDNYNADTLKQLELVIQKVGEYEDREETNETNIDLVHIVRKQGVAFDIPENDFSEHRITIHIYKKHFDDKQWQEIKKALNI